MPLSAQPSYAFFRAAMSFLMAAISAAESIGQYRPFTIVTSSLLRADVLFLERFRFRLLNNRRTGIERSSVLTR